MICFVDIEHPKAFETPEARQRHVGSRFDIAQRLEEASGDLCYVQHYRRLSADKLLRHGVKAVAISGNSTDWWDYDFDEFKELFRFIRGLTVPTIGFCGGHQLIGMACGAKADAMRPLNPGEEDRMAGYHPGMFKESGFFDVEIVRPDPLLEGFGPTVNVCESHYWEIKELPGEFLLLASTPECRVQAFRHKDRPLYGTQFHPEAYDDDHPQGRQILRNFFEKVVGLG
ncbi:MAG: gamma-glutamyl-gamma-aminobutyrate hydrolase family protein [Armatimonadetes bacterium]|nr:gamma-glutamyl-gamma-aminobutyrate hydrolase family protein [Armatimonadota bacterium]